MKKYYITTTHGGDEFTTLKTDDKAEAIAEARRESKNKYNDSVEIRIYAQDIEDEGCDCWDYDILRFYEKRYAIRDCRTGIVVDECEYLIEAEETAKQLEFDDRENGIESCYEIYDRDEEKVWERKVELKDRRVIAHLKQRELAEAAGVSIKTLQDYESGRKNINTASASTVKKIAEALGCQMEELIQ